MEKDIGRLQIEFDESARTVFFHNYTKFRSATSGLIAEKDNDVFDQVKGKYMYSLKMQLEDLAKKFMELHRKNIQLENLEKILPGIINRYMDEFRIKSSYL